MDYGRIIVDAWKLARHTSTLWRLAIFSAVQVLFYSIMVGGLIAPMAILTQLLVAARRGALDATSGGQTPNDRMSDSLTGFAAWLAAHWALFVFVILVLSALWAVSGVLDVAATAGIVEETESATQGRETSVPNGLRAGFRIWWRTVGLLAVSALPTVLYMVIVALHLFFTVTLPLQRGELPSAAAIATGNQLGGPSSTLLTLVNIPLGVLVALGLRFAVLEDREWRDSFGRAWRLARTRLADVVLMYLVLFGVTTLVSLLFAIVLLIVVGFATVAVVWLSVPAGTLNAAGVGVIVFGAVLLLALSLAFLAVTITWQSVTWTIFWRRTTGREEGLTAESQLGAPHIPAVSEGAGQ